MKKIIAIVFAFMFLVSNVTFAEVHDEAILLRNVTWGSDYATVKEVLPDGVETYGLKTEEYWYPILDRMYDTTFNYLKAELGCYTYTKSSTMKNVKVAGYAVDAISLYFVYHVGPDDLLVKDDAHTSLIFAEYKLEPKDSDAVYSDLVNKLSSLYGDIDQHQQESVVITREQNLWYGAEGTMVSVVKEDYPTGSHYIYIRYGYADADELVAKAYDAVMLEEAQNAASNIDGL